jgi:hypothetical protein
MVVDLEEELPPARVSIDAVGHARIVTRRRDLVTSMSSLQPASLACTTSAGAVVCLFDPADEVLVDAHRISLSGPPRRAVHTALSLSNCAAARRAQPGRPRGEASGLRRLRAPIVNTHMAAFKVRFQTRVPPGPSKCR